MHGLQATAATVMQTATSCLPACLTIDSPAPPYLLQPHQTTAFQACGIKHRLQGSAGQPGLHGALPGGRAPLTLNPKTCTLHPTPLVPFKASRRHTQAPAAQARVATHAHDPDVRPRMAAWSAMASEHAWQGSQGEGQTTLLQLGGQ